MEKTIPQHLRAIGFHYGSSQWEGRYERVYNSVESYIDIKNLILGADANTKIFAMRDIATLIIDLLSRDEKRDLYSVLKNQLSDNRMCDIGYPPTYADEADTITVSKASEAALKRLEEYIKDVDL